MNRDVTSAVSGWVGGSAPSNGLYLMLHSEFKSASGPAPPGKTSQVGQLAPPADGDLQRGRGRPLPALGGLSWPLPSELDDAALEAKPYPA